jgi:DNA excision repair protein ERCC-2
MRFILDGLEVLFPYDFVYKEQYQYMLELKRALDAKGDGLLEMPTGTGKTVSILSLVTSYQAAHPDCGKLIYCTRTVPEMVKCMEELKRVVEYRRTELASGAATGGAGAGGGARGGGGAIEDLLAVCLSSRRNLCIHPDVVDESDREKVDAACRSMTASWVRQRAQSDASVKTCDFFEGYERGGTDADLRGIYTIDDLKALGRAKGWCPYFLARHVISYANVVVYNYQYMLDPKIATLISRELEDRSIVVFDEAHNIDNVCIEALSVTLDRRTLDTAARNLNSLEGDVKRMREADASRLQEEYQRLVAGLGGVGGDSSSLGMRAAAEGGGGGGGGGRGGGGRGGAGAGGGAGGGGEEFPAAPVLPSDVLAEAVPGNIRNAELFVRFMKHVVRWLKERIKVAAVESVTPGTFLAKMGTELAIDTKPLRFAYSRLNSLLRTLQVTDVDDFTPLQLVADFATLLATYPVGFMVILEPFNSKTPHIPDPLMQLTCLDASLAIKPVFAKFQSVILTSGTLSPLDMYPKMLNFQPVVRVSLEMSIDRPCICPMVVTRGSDQTPLSTKFESREDPGVVRNYGALLTQTCAAVPDGIVAFFPSYSYMELIISAWHTLGVLRAVEQHKLLFIETKDIVETTLALNNYKRACDNGRGAVFFSIARGKVAEGIDFDRHYGRAVLLFGIPFQYTLSVVLRARLAYLRDTFHIREQDFLTFDAMRQAAQCVGRIIRSKKDYGIIIFADKRYASADKRSKLPQWVLQFLPDAHLGLSTDMAVHTARAFLKSMAQPVAPNAGLGKNLLSAADVAALAAEEGTRAALARPLPPIEYPDALVEMGLIAGGGGEGDGGGRGHAASASAAVAAASSAASSAAAASSASSSLAAGIAAAMELDAADATRVVEEGERAGAGGGSGGAGGNKRARVEGEAGEAGGAGGGSGGGAAAATATTASSGGGGWGEVDEG